MQSYKTSFNNLPPEAWRSLTGQDTETLPVRAAYEASGILARCVDVAADSVAALPFDIVNQAGEVVDDSENYRNVIGILPDLPRLLWLTEASMKIFGAAYLYNEPSAVRGKTAKVRVLSPAGLTVTITQSGEVTYKRNDSQQTEIPAHLISPLWEGDPYIEFGPPSSSVADRAALAAGVVVNADKFAARFFERGAIKGTIFGIDTADRAEREKFQSWVERLFNGIGNAWRQAVFNLRGVQPVVIGEGLESLSNPALVEEKNRAVMIAFGIPASLLISDAANYATAQQDKRNFYNDLIIPDSTQIAALFTSAIRKASGLAGYKLRCAPERLPIMAETNAEKAKAALDLAQVLAHGKVGLVSLRVAGYPLSDEQISEIEQAIRTAETPANEFDAASEPKTPEVAATAATEPKQPVGDLAKWQAKAIKSLAKRGSAQCEFASNSIGGAARKIIESALPHAATEQAIRDVFRAAAEWEGYP